MGDSTFEQMRQLDQLLLEREISTDLPGCIPVEEPSHVVSAAIFNDHDHADYAYEVIMERIKEFEDTLDDDHEIAIKLASFGQNITMSVTEIGYSNPTTLIFSGYVGKQRAELIQHMSQLNFLLLSVEKEDPKKPALRLGFALPEKD